MPDTNPLMILTTLAAAMMMAWMVLRVWPALRDEVAGHGGLASSGLATAKPRLHALDGLRGILCIGVLTHHAAITRQIVITGLAWPLASSGVFDLLGHSAVAFFFAITGFLFWGRVIEHGIHFGWLAFYRGRVLRIVPLYVLLAALAGTLLLTDRDADAISARRLANFFGEVFSFGFQKWSPIAVGARSIRTESFDAGVHWSLRYEWVFYFALPVLALFSQRRRPLLLAALTLWAMVALGTRRQLPASLMFTIGMLAAHAVRSPTIVTMLNRRAASGGVLIVTAMLLVCAAPRVWMMGIAPTNNGISPLAFILTTLIFVPIASGNSMFGLLEQPTLRLLGSASYSVYLLHGIVLYVARPWIVPLVDPTSPSNWRYVLAIAALAAIVTGLSCVTYSFIESPFIALDKRLRTRTLRSAKLAP